VMKTSTRNVIGMILVALACFTHGVKVDADWYYDWLAPVTIAIVGYFAIVSGLFLKILLHFVAVLVLWFVLVHQYDSGIEFFMLVIPLLSAKSSFFLLIFISVSTIWHRFRGRTS